MNGIAHLVEHINLRLRPRDDVNIANKKYSSSGKTNFDNTVLEIVIEYGVNSILDSFTIISGIINNSITDIDEFTQCKEEVQEEFYSLEKDINNQQMICEFITDGRIKTIPIGSIDCINKLTVEDANIFMREHYFKENIAIIIASDINLPDIAKITDNFFAVAKQDKINKVYQKEIYYPDKFFLLKNDEPTLNRICCYFQRPYKLIDLRGKIVRTLFEMMMNNYIVKQNVEYNFTNVSVSDKHITEFYYFTVIKFDSIDGSMPTEKIQLVINTLRTAQFTEDNFKVALALFSNYNVAPCCEELDFVVNNLISNFLYNEPIHITYKSCKEIESIVNKLSVEDINLYKREVISSSARVVVFNNENSIQ